MEEKKDQQVKEEDKIRKLAEAASAISSGKLDTDIDSNLYGHLGDLAKSIDGIRKNLLTLSSSIEDQSGKVPSAIDQITDVTNQAEKVTLNIFKYVEKVQDNTNLLSDCFIQIKEEIVKKTINFEELDLVFSKIDNTLLENKDTLMSIIAGLSFQDVSGQKLKKAREKIHELEKKLLELIVIFGFDKKQVEEKEKSQDMLNELQKSDTSQALNQDLVDNILSEFGFLDT